MPGSVNARSDVSRAHANARDTRKDAMTKPRFKEVVPHDKHPPEPRNRPSQINTRNDQARHIVAGCASALPTLADMWQALDDALTTRSALCRAGHAGFRPSLTAPGWTGPTCAPRCAPRSPRTPTASPTPCGTSGTS